VRSLLLQDWTTIRADGAVTSVKQPEATWLELSAFSDLVFWLEVKEYIASATFYVYYETATLREDAAFVSLASLAMASGVNVTTLFKETSATPVAKWVRWRLVNQSGALWDATFRIWVSAAKSGAGRPVKVVTLVGGVETG
jgi:hypothetical protein